MADFEHRSSCMSLSLVAEDIALFEALNELPIPEKVSLRAEIYTFLTRARMFRKSNQQNNIVEAQNRIHFTVNALADAIQYELDNSTSQDPRKVAEGLVRLEYIFFRFQLELHFVTPLIKLYPRLIEKLWSMNERVTSQHPKYLPVVDIDCLDFQPVLQIARRHPFDDRFDKSPVNIGQEYCAFGEGHPLYEFSKLDPFSNLQYAMEHDRDQENEDLYLQEPLLHCKLTATYPWVFQKPVSKPASRKFSNVFSPSSRRTSVISPITDHLNFEHSSRPASIIGAENIVTSIPPRSPKTTRRAYHESQDFSPNSSSPRASNTSSPTIQSPQLPLASTTTTTASNPMTKEISGSSLGSSISKIFKTSKVSRKTSYNMSNIFMGNSSPTMSSVQVGATTPHTETTTSESEAPSKHASNTSLHTLDSSEIPGTPKKEQQPKHPYTKSDGKVLSSDPNNDGFIILKYPGLVIGSVVDGSGSGYQARLASNMILAIVHELSQELVDSFVNSIKEPVTTMTIQNWLKKVTITCNRRIQNVYPAGCTCATIYVVCNLKTSVKNQGNDDDDSICCFVMIGDVEGYQYKASTESWKALHKDPAAYDKIRLDTSYTPGGIGNYHGSPDRIFGLYLWDDEDWGTQIPNDEKTEPKNSNLHFGQVNLSKSDLLFFCTDGIGDAIDPIQIFQRPSDAYGCARFINSNWMSKVNEDAPLFSSWEMFSKSVPFATFENFQLKLDILNYITQHDLTELLPTMMNSTSSSSQNNISTSNPGSGVLVNPRAIVEKCIDFAFYTTDTSRKIRSDETYNEYSSDSGSSSPSVMDTRSVNERFNRRRKSVFKKFREFICQYAKPDHIGVTCFQVGILDSNSTTTTTTSSAS